MSRRELIEILGGAAVSWEVGLFSLPIAAEARQVKAPNVGFLAMWPAPSGFFCFRKGSRRFGLGGSPERRSRAALRGARWREPCGSRRGKQPGPTGRQRHWARVGHRSGIHRKKRRAFKRVAFVEASAYWRHHRSGFYINWRLGSGSARRTAAWVGGLILA
jgi:hypothetical protein